MKNTIIHSNSLPLTKLGLWAIWLEVTFLLMFIATIMINLFVIEPNGGQQPLTAVYVGFVILMLICGLVGGVFAVITVVKQKQRAPILWISVLFGLLVLLLVLNELTQGIRYILGV
jgi:hypothetical protein